jgi:hypothetical protein
VRRAVAEQLPQRLLVIRDAVPLDESDKIRRRVARQRGAREMRVVREKVLGPAVDVGEVAAAAAGDEDLATDLIVAFEHHDAPAPLPCPRGAEQTRRAATENDQIE